MTPLEEQVEKLAREWEKDADEGELLDEVAYALEGAADELRALLPLEVTDESAVALTKGEIEAILAPHDGMRPDTPEARRDTRTGTAKLHAALSAALTQKGDNE